MTMPEITDHETWFAAATELLTREKAVRRELDDLAASRRQLPMVRVEADYRFYGPDGERTLPQLFGDHRQLIVQHFMFDPSWDEGCGSCTAMAGSAATPITLEHLARRGTAFAAVSRAPWPRLQAYQQDQGWTFPWYSSYGSDFNWDFHVSFDPDVAPATFNYRDEAQLRAHGMGWLTTYTGEQPGISCFLRQGEEIFHTYSTYARGIEPMLPAYHLLDLTALGRQEEWEQPHGRAPVVYRHDRGVLSGEVKTAAQAEA